MNPPLPPADDLQRALLHPALCFRDPDLARGRARLSPFGLPVAWSGQFATVFRLDTPAGARAVRCFTAALSDQPQRYEALQDALRRHPLPAFAAFDLLPNGILVQGNRFPILKMEWVEGLPLDRAVEQALAAGDQASLRAWADALPPLLDEMARARLAHGDLQHENILACGRTLRLVDFDGVWLPPLDRLGALETGHPHYQHPRRDSRDFGAHIDRFPALVLALSLRALANDPTLWARYHSDKHLILRREDFAAPIRSPLILELTRSDDPIVRRLTLALAQACGAPPSDTAELGVLVEAPVGQGAGESERGPGNGQQGRSLRSLFPVPRSLIPIPSPRIPPALDSAVARIPFSDALADGVIAAWGVLRAAPPRPPLPTGQALLLLPAVGGGGAVAVAWLQSVGAGGAAGWLATGIGAGIAAGALAFAQVVGRDLRIAAAAHLTLLLTAAALSAALTPTVALAALLSTALAALPLLGRAGQPIPLARLAASTLLAALAPALLWAARTLVPGVLGTAAAPALVSLLIAPLAAPVALLTGRLARAAGALLAAGRIERV